MSKSITQDMRYRQSLMQYAAKYGVSRASRKYNKSRSYIYFWKARWDGSVASLACQSRRPHHHPNQHTEAELKLIRDMRRRNPTLGMVELWHRLRKRGYIRCPESLFRVMRKLGMFPQPKVKATYKAKPYEQMQYPGQRVQVDVKVVPLKCLTNPEERLYQYTAIDEYTRLRYLGAYPEQSTYSSADFLEKMVAWFKRRGVRVECVQTDNCLPGLHLPIVPFFRNKPHRWNRPARRGRPAAVFHIAVWRSPTVRGKGARQSLLFPRCADYLPARPKCLPMSDKWHAFAGRSRPFHKR